MIAVITSSLVDVAKSNAYNFRIFSLTRTSPMPIINNLLTRASTTSQELYKAFETKNVKAFFTTIKKVTTTISITQALEIDDTKQTLRILNYDALFALAATYRAGDEAAGIPRNSKRFQICLAMIAMDEQNSEIRDMRATRKALSLLQTYYEANPSDNLTVEGTGGKKLLDLVKLKMIANEQFTQATVIDSAKISPSGEPFIKDSSHLAQPVIYQSDPKAENSQTDFIRKHEVEARVAGIEVFCGTLMQLFLGLGQPTTLQEEKKLNGTVPILSEKIKFERFTDVATFKLWAEGGFRHAAETDVACVFLADDDCSLKNAGLRKDNGLPVRIDFDKSIAPITLRLVGRESQPKKQRINNTDYTLAGLYEVDGFVIHADDFNNLPLLATKMPRPEIVLTHYVPSNWWANNFIADTETFEKIKALQTDPAYQEAKFRAILEKIILPNKLIEYIAELTIFHAADKKEVVAWMKERQRKLAIQAENIVGFADYVKNNGARALDSLKISFETFVAKRSDLKIPAKTILQDYQTNLNTLQSYVRDSIHVDTRPVTHQPLKTHSEDLFSFLEEMKSKGAKLAQKEFFISKLPALSNTELDALFQYMQKVQLGLIADHHFKTVRTERHPTFYTSGNTNTWVDMRHAVKEEIITKLKHAYHDDGKIILESYSYDEYHKVMSKHSGRFFKRFGKTQSAAAFEKMFSRAVDNQTPTASRYERGK
jgi:hypothetical protein